MGRQPEIIRRGLLAALVLGLLVLGVQPLAAQDDDPPGPVYIVQAGDSLFSISLAFGVSVDDLRAANGITDSDVISIGQRLVIPGLDVGAGVLTTRAVRPGDSLKSLSLAVDVAVPELVRLNHIVNPFLLYVGQPLIHTTPEGQPEIAGLTEGRVLVARAGETPLTLAARYGQSPEMLAAMNDLAHPGLLFAGQRVVTPVAGVALSGLPAPMLGIELRPERPAHGQPIGVYVQVEAGATLTGQLADWELNFQPAAEGVQVALQGIYAFTDPGLYPLQITATAADGRVSQFDQFIAISDANYAYQQLLIDDSLGVLLDPVIETEEGQRIFDLATPFNATRYWTDAWVGPVPMDRVTAPFGVRRSYNGGPYASFHGGVDLGGPSTTPVVAPAPGVVLLAEPLIVRGQAVLIDHGWGVYSGYWHLSSITVTAGQTVATGQQIGFIGSTGRSTGNHLHWEIWVNGAQVDPLVWLENNYP